MSLSNKLKRRLLPMLLSVVMVFQSLPSMAWASPDDQSGNYDRQGQYQDEGNNYVEEDFVENEAPEDEKAPDVTYLGEGEIVTEEAMLNITTFNIPEDATVTDIEAATGWDDADWMDLDWTDKGEKYFKLSNVSGNFIVVLGNDDEDHSVSNTINISGNKAEKSANTLSFKSQTQKLYGVKKYELVTISEESDMFVKIPHWSSEAYNATKFKVVKTDLFNSASQNAIPAVTDSALPTPYNITDSNPYYYDLVIKLDVFETGMYKIEAKKDDDTVVRTTILDNEGKSKNTVYSTDNLVLEAGTYFLVYNYGENYITVDDDEDWGKAVRINVTIARATTFKAELKEGEEAFIYYAYRNGNYVNAGTDEEYWAYSNSAFTDKYNFSLVYSDGSKKENIYITSSDEDFLSKNDFSEWNVIGLEYNVIFTYYGCTGTTKVQLVNWLDKNDDYDDAEELVEDDVVTGVSYGYYSFTAVDAGEYYFYSLNPTGTIDPSAVLKYRGNDVLDDDSYDGKNFFIAKNMKAGEKVVLSCSYFKGSGDYSIKVSRFLPDLGYVSLDKFNLTGKTINLVFLVDTTGSMREEIAAVRDNLVRFVGRITATHANLRMSLIDFKDITEDNGNDPTIIYYNKNNEGSVWYENYEAEDLKKVINDNLKASGGDDYPECDVDALANLVFDDIYTWNSAAAKFAFLITDADYKNDNIHGIKDMEEVTDMLAKKGIAVTTITKKSLYDTYSDLTTRTGGTLLNIDDDFGTGMDRFAYNMVRAAESYMVDPSLVPVTGIDLGGDLTVPLGRTRNFTPVITPSNATNKDVVWRVVDPDIARIVSVTPTKLAVKGIKNGTTKIVAISKDGGYTASFELTVATSVVDGDMVESCDSKDLITYLDRDDLKEYRLVVDSTETTLVDAADQKTIYKAIKGKDKSIGFEFMDLIGDLSYSWKFKGDKITAEDKAISDFAIAVNPESKALEIAVAEGFQAYLPIGFKHHGDLAGTADIAFVTNLVKNGTYDLYYYNEETGKLEDLGKTVTVSDNTADFDITHCSTYVLGSKKEELSNKMEVIFESNGGSAVPSQSLLLGQKVVKPADPTKEGFTFEGWFKEAACENEWDFDKDIVRGKTILYAKWGVPVESVALDKTGEMELIAELDTVALNATVTPANATDKSLIWSSSDAKVATVTDGTIKAVGKGTATITVKSASNEKATATVKVIVTAKPTDTIIVKGSVTLKPGAKVASWEFEDGYNNVISAKKSSKSCTIKGKAKGTVGVKAVMKDGSVKNYVVRVENVTLADRTFDTKATLNAQDLIVGSRLAEVVKYKSSSKKVISIDSKTGAMSVLKNGKVKISVTFGKTTIKKTYKVVMPEAAKKSVSVKAGKMANVNIKNFNAALGDYSVVIDNQAVAGAAVEPTGKIVIIGKTKGKANATLYVNGVEYSKFKIKVK